MSSRATENLALADAISAVGTPEFCQSLSTYIDAQANFDAIVFIAYFGNQNPWLLHCQYRDPVVIQGFDSDYLSGLYLLDPAYQLHLNTAEAGVYRLRDIAPDRFRQTEYFKRYYEKTTVIDEQIILVVTNSNVTITISVCTDRTSGKEFSIASRKRLHETAPAICALLAQHWADLKPPVDNDKGQPDDVVQNIIDFALEVGNVSLTRRQAEVALLVLRGFSSHAIGERLGISRQTVKVFRRQLYARCKISSQLELYTMLMPALAD